MSRTKRDRENLVLAPKLGREDAHGHTLHGNNFMKEIKISINSILLDVENPRIDPVRAQREAIKGLMERGGHSKIFALAADILLHGTNPSDILLCVEHRMENGKRIYIAKEGNRRLLALKGIANPRIFNNAQWSSRMARLIHKAGGIGQAPKKIRIQVYADAERDAMNHWIEIKHKGENKGAGTVPWGAKEKARFMSKGNHINVSMSLIEWLKNNPDVSADDKEKLKTVPVTTLERIVSSVPGKSILGLEIKDAHLQALRRPERVREDILSIVRDLTTPSIDNPKKKRINVSDVKNTTQINAYLTAKFPAQNNADNLSEPVQITTGDDTVATGGVGIAQTNKHPSAKVQIGTQTYLCKRLRLVGDVASNEKIKKLITELCSFKIASVPLSFCIACRSLLEVSMLQFAHANRITTDNGKGSSLKYSAIAVKCKDSIITLPKWSAGVPLNWINEAVRLLNTDTLFSITELNNLVHGTAQIPSAETILTYMPRLIPFLIALNGGNPPEEG